MIALMTTICDAKGQMLKKTALPRKNGITASKTSYP
jgi:hypothetical protein